jgi:hypothetical protein
VRVTRLILPGWASAPLRRHGLRCAPAAALLAGIAGAWLIPPAVTASATTAPQVSWLISSNAINLLKQAGASSALLTEAFGNKNAYVVGKPSAGSLGIPTATYDSYADIQRAFADGALPGPYQAVLLDMEHWQFTPPAEQKSPEKYERLAAALVHQHTVNGHMMLFIAAPATDIVAARCQCSGSSARYYYLHWDIAGGAARDADVVDIQAQNDETQLSSYASFVSQAAADAKQANPHVVVLSGLSTDNGPAEIWGGQLFQAYQAVRAQVAGYWLNIPAKSAQCPACGGPFPRPALSLLRKIYG